MKNKRMALSKKLRFEVFKRDGFTCQYCSQVSPNVVLEVDHIVPVCNGGTNDTDNLITACFDCNRGKGGVELNSVTENTVDKSKRIKEALKQYKEFKKILVERECEILDEIYEIENVYHTAFPEYIFSATFKNSVKGFIEKIGFFETKRAMEIACSKIYRSDKVLRYFCGICWNIIKDKHNG